MRQLAFTRHAAAVNQAHAVRQKEAYNGDGMPDASGPCRGPPASNAIQMAMATVHWMSGTGAVLTSKLVQVLGTVCQAKPVDRELVMAKALPSAGSTARTCAP